ncbi:MAG TPA: hypothetical protein VMF09_02150 [Solirubrobacteraceae bacterium]|nr:hypothetical protein [Solirubrobacteraceae bacterium]
MLAACVVGALSAGQAQARSTSYSSAAAQSETCLVHSLPSFIAQGEFADAATVADVVEVECNPFAYGTGGEVTVTAAQLFSRCHEISWYVPNEGGTYREARGSSVNLRLDVDGNASVGLIAGPKCMAGESLITLDEDESPYETFTTSFQVLPSVETSQGVLALPASQVEDAESSAVVTIVEAEFSGEAEAKVRLGARQLYDRCEGGEKLIWAREDREVVSGPELADEQAVQLDDNGNGFAIAIGSDSCAQGGSVIEADLETSPFTTETTEFTVLPPQPTEEPSFTLEKLQEIAGSGAGFTTEPLTASVGQTVDYAIVVTNTANVEETFTGFTDPGCDAGTIAGGPGSSPVAPGQSTRYTCAHRLSKSGPYVNVAAVTGDTADGRPLEKTSNQVEVTTPVPMPKFTIEKLQELAGAGTGFTSEQLSGMVGQTVDYEIVIDNTGNVSLTFSSFTDPHCDPGTIAGGPGASPVLPGDSTTYTCSHVLASPGSVVNVATVTATPPEEGPITESSPPVEVKVIAPEPAFTIEKLQRLAGSAGAFTTTQLEGAVGETVEYEIILKNTGNVPLPVSGFSDSHCDPGTLAGGPGGASLAPGASTTYTCTHLLGAEPSFVNVAFATVTPTEGEPIELKSHEVEVVVPGSPGPGSGQLPASTNVSPKGGVLASCEVSRPVLRGVAGPERGTFTASVRSLGIKQITFYLDGRKLKSMKQASARHGLFKIKIRARKLSYGPHRVSFTTVMSNPNCANAASSRVFVHPYAARRAPRFTG